MPTKYRENSIQHNPRGGGCVTRAGPARPRTRGPSDTPCRKRRHVRESVPRRSRRAAVRQSYRTSPRFPFRRQGQFPFEPPPSAERELDIERRSGFQFFSDNVCHHDSPCKTEVMGTPRRPATRILSEPAAGVKLSSAAPPATGSEPCAKRASARRLFDTGQNLATAGRPAFTIRTDKV